MQTHDTLFTPTEAAVLTGLPLKAVNNAIDKKTIAVAARGSRLVDARGLVSLALERRLADRLAPELRREVFDALAGSLRNVVSLEGGLVKIDLRELRRELTAALRDLRRARRLVVSDREILGGDPVFAGTRIPVHVIAKLAEQGASPMELTASYPRLTLEMIRLAPIYAAAYPLRGRPRRQSWHDQPPVRKLRRRLSSFEIS